MNPDDIARILDDLGTRLGPAGEYVFQLAVRQKIIEGVLGVAAGAGGLIVVVLIAWRLTNFGRKRWQAQMAAYTTARAGYDARAATDQGDYRYESEPREPDFMDFGFVLIFAGLFGMITCGTLVGVLLSAVPKLLNPEYAALTDILSRIVP